MRWKSPRPSIVRKMPSMRLQRVIEVNFFGNSVHVTWQNWESDMQPARALMWKIGSLNAHRLHRNQRLRMPRAAMGGFVSVQALKAKAREVFGQTKRQQNKACQTNQRRCSGTKRLHSSWHVKSRKLTTLALFQKYPFWASLAWGEQTQWSAKWRMSSLLGSWPEDKLYCSCLSACFLPHPSGCFLASQGQA